MAQSPDAPQPASRAMRQEGSSSPDGAAPSIKRYWLLVAALMLLGVGLRSPALLGSLLADDWDHYAMHAGVYPVHRGPLDLYDFVAKDPLERQAFLRSGRFPWWTSPDIHLAVMRPVASALIHLDFTVLDGQHHPSRMHWHSMLWWLLLVGGVAAVLPMALPRRVAALAVGLYALDDAHTLPVTWSANRSELVAVALVTWALWARLAARTRDFRAGRWLAPALVALALLAGEHALGPLGYIAAFEVFAGEGGAKERVRTLAPFALLTLAYLVVRPLLGYGIAGSSFYVDPFAEPLRYLMACAERLPLLLSDVTFGIAAEWKYWGPPFRQALLERHVLPPSWLTLPVLARLQTAIGWLAVGVLAVVLVRARRAVRRDGSEIARSLYWLLWGGLLALVPTCGTLAMSRLTVAAAIGFDAALAWLLLFLFDNVHRAGLFRRLAAGLLAALVVAVHVLHSAVRTFDECAMYSFRSVLEESWVLRAQLSDRDVASQNVMLIAARDWASEFAMPYVRHLHGLPMPASTDLLSAASDSPHELVRVAPTVLDVELPVPIVGTRFLTSVYRHKSAPFRPGDRVSAPRFDVEVLETSDGEPRHLRFRFPVSLDDPRYVFLYPADVGMVRLTMPHVGERFRLPPPAWPSPEPSR